MSMEDNLRLQAVGCDMLGSPFYARLLERMVDDLEAGGPTAMLLAPYADASFEVVVPLRVLGRVHRLVLDGDAPELATHFPSTDGDGDAGAAWPVFRDVLAANVDQIAAGMSQEPQTNEVGRSAALVGGFLTVAAETGLPLRIRELGASAGLNLRFDHFFFSCAGRSYGDPASPVRFEDVWNGGCPPLDVPAVVADRRGCDRHPIDPTTHDGQLTLLSYVWPDQRERFPLLRAAFEVAMRVPATVDAASAADWLARELATPAPGLATVVYHSVFWSYLDDDQRAEIRGLIEEAGGRATDDAPLAWLKFETPEAGEIPFAVRLTVWPGGEERLLARAHPHVGPVDWVA